jgi:hypothetical protein
MVIVKTCLVALLVQAVNLPLVVCHVTKGTNGSEQKVHGNQRLYKRILGHGIWREGNSSEGFY